MANTDPANIIVNLLGEPADASREGGTRQAATEFQPETFKPPKRYSLSNPSDRVKVKVQVMQRVKGCPGHFSSEMKMAQIGPRVRATRVARARRIGRAVVLGEPGVPDVETPVAREELAVPRVSRRQHA